MRILLPPIQWNAQNDDMDSRELGRWINEYERQHLPAATVFPSPGQLWEAKHDCEVGFVALIGPEARYTDVKLRDTFLPRPFPFGRARLSKGEKLRVIHRSHLPGEGSSKPLGAHLRPLRYAELEREIVPPDLRSTPGYTGYVLYIRTARAFGWFPEHSVFLNQDFRLLEAGE